MNWSPYIVHEDKEGLAGHAAGLILNAADEFIKQRGQFTIALSGGNTPRMVFEHFQGNVRIDGPKWHIFWSDERCVPPDDPESNYRMARESFLDHVPIPPENIHRLRGESDPAPEAARYEADIRQTVLGDPLPRFDLILLGMGDDGHTASLFPGTEALKETERLVVANYVPQKSSWRLTFTYPLINAAHDVLILVSGASKAERLHAVLHLAPGETPYPINGVTNIYTRLMVDRDAAPFLGIP
jgi:6-phosphogluconolactonase